MRYALEASLKMAAETEVLVDFRNLEWVEPFPMLHLAASLRQKTAVPIVDASAPAYGYAAYMGFFRAIGMDFGEAPRIVDGQKRYAPIAALDVQAIVEQAREKRRPPEEFLSNRASNLAAILTQTSSGSLHAVVAYAVRELMRNVLDHSEASLLWFCAQSWPERRLVEVSILDEGCGLAGSLRKNPALTIPDHAAAIETSLLPGITGSTGRKLSGFYGNSGYGLYVTHQLCLLGRGSLLLATGDAAMLSDGAGPRSLVANTGGTAIRITLDLDAVQGGSLEIDRIVEAGEKEARSHGGLRQASAASRNSET